MTGWTKKPRSRFGHHLFAREKFCRGYAWDWLCDKAAFNPTVIDVQGKSIHLERGQICHSIRFIANAWNWDKAAVSRFLTRLKTETMIETHTETGLTVITICNYEKFNRSESSPETPTETAPETKVRQERDSSETDKKNDKNEKKERRAEAPVDDLFPATVPKPEPKDAIGILAEVVPRELAESFVAHRKALKKPLTVQGATMAANRLKTFQDPQGAVSDAIMNGWSGVFDRGPPNTTKSTPTTSGLMARVNRKYGG